MHIRLSIDIKPKPAARPRMTKSGHVYVPKTTREWQEEFKKQAAEQYPFQPISKMCGIRVIAFTTSDIQSIKSGDVDNLLKNVMDAMTDVVYTDDRFVVQASLEYFQDNFNCVVIDIWEVNSRHVDRHYAPICIDPIDIARPRGKIPVGILPD